MRVPRRPLLASVAGLLLPEVAHAALPTVPHEETRVVVLMYHSFGAGNARRNVDPAELDSQLAWLRDSGVAIVPLSTYLDFLDRKVRLPKHVVVITIDDGERNVFKAAYPVFKKHKAPFSLGLPTNLIGRKELTENLSWAEVETMRQSGLCEVASHGHTHEKLTGLDEKQARRELELSRAIIEKRTGVRPEAHFYPFGATNPRIEAMTRELGYRAAFTAWGFRVGKGDRRTKIPRWGITRHFKLWKLDMRLLGRAPRRGR